MADDESTVKVAWTIRNLVPYDLRQQLSDVEVIIAGIKAGITSYDKRVVINILANRTSSQRQIISEVYKKVCKKELLKELKSDLGGCFDDLIAASLTPKDEFYARELNYAMSGFGFVVSDNILIEILCILDGSMIKDIKNAYLASFKKSLEVDVERSTSNHFQMILLSILQNPRDEKMEICRDQVFFDADLLQETVELRETDLTIVIEILTGRPWSHLAKVFREFDVISGVPFERAIRKIFTGNAREAAIAIYYHATDSDGYFADSLYNNLTGLTMSKKDRTLTRLVVTRADIDMANIKVAFLNKYLKTLEEYIDGGCSGDYKRFLLAYISPFS